MTEPLVLDATATRTRYWVIAFAASLATITYIDRVAIAQAAPFISAELKLTPVRMGYVLAAFGWSYAAFEVPSGWLGDRTGAKSALTRIVTFWSVFTAATAWAWNFTSLFIIRFLFGAGEAGCFPNLTKALKAWLPQREQARAQGIMWMSARLGGAFAPYFVFLMFRHFSWQRAFVLLGVIGFVWVAIFFRWYRDDPHTHPAVNQGERVVLPKATHTPAHVTGIPWKRLLTSKAVWLLSVQYFCLGYGWEFYVSWLPTYLIRGRHVPLQTASVLSGLPLFMGALACGTSAVLYPRMVNWFGSRQRTWRNMAYLGFSGAALLLFLSTNITQPITAVACMALSSFANDLTMPGTWAAAMEVGGPYAGTTSAFMNMLSCISGSVQSVLTGYVIHWTNGNWRVAIYSFVAVYMVGFMCWLPLGSLLTSPDREFALAPGQ